MPGADVRLTIDRYIQRLIENELDFQMKAHSRQRRHDHRHGPEDRRDPRHGEPAELQALGARPSTTPDLDLYRTAPSPTSTSPAP